MRDGDWANGSLRFVGTPTSITFQHLARHGPLKTMAWSKQRLLPSRLFVDPCRSKKKERIQRPSWKMASLAVWHLFSCYDMAMFVLGVEHLESAWQKESWRLVVSWPWGKHIPGICSNCDTSRKRKAWHHKGVSGACHAIQTYHVLKNILL